MALLQRMKVANEKHSKTITQRGHVQKTAVLMIISFICRLIPIDEVIKKQRCRSFKLAGTGRGEISSGTVAPRSVCVCSVWISYFSDHTEYQTGDVGS
ncbi:uncharacterized protein zgc:85858 isoform X1 [Silurus meridionalis]|uniref:uncharacterized protein zgc:85858 isoform X1 n=1 Tax=Silurus meridionalis TaxID=175797 RepID=UPI001EEB3A6D|nr:uncharacterized protein zgc:85858 isoform X1 [Silurus meridionalis]